MNIGRRGIHCSIKSILMGIVNVLTVIQHHSAMAIMMAILIYGINGYTIINTDYTFYIPVFNNKNKHKVVHLQVQLRVHSRVVRVNNKNREVNDNVLCYAKHTHGV